MDIKSFFSSIMHKVDFHLAVLILFSSLVLLFLSVIFITQIVFFEVAIAAVCASALYLLVRNRFNIFPTLCLNFSSRIIKILNVSFFLGIIFINYTFHTNLYRPSIYYILVTLCSALIVLDILYGKNKYYVFWTLFKILIITFTLRAGLFYEYPGFYGVDPWSHIFHVQLYKEIGYINSGLVELLQSNYPPIFHIEILTSVLLTDLNLKHSFFFSAGFAYCTTVFFIFLYVKKIAGVEVGLLSSLFIAINQFHVAWGAWLIPTSIGVLMFSILLYLIHSKVNKIEYGILIILISITLVYMHTLSPLVISIAIFVYLISNHLFAHICSCNSSSKINFKITTYLVVILGTLTFSQFMYRTYSGGRTFLEFVLYPLSNTVSTDAGFAGGDIASYTASSYPLNRVSFLIIIAFTLFGSLFWLKRENQTPQRIGLIATAIALIFFSYGPALFNIENFIPGRWLVFIMIVLAPISVIGMYQVSLIPSKKRYQIFLLLLIIVLFTFFSINNNGVNPSTPFYGELSKDPFRSAYTYSELQAAVTITTINVGPIEAEPSYLSQPSLYSQPFLYYQMEIFGADYTLNPQKYYVTDVPLKVVRIYDITHQMETNKTTNNTIEREQGNLIYNNRFVWATIQKPNKYSSLT